MASPFDTDLFAALYQELKTRARRLRLAGATLDTTALVHEAWLKLHAGEHCSVDRAHLFRTAALAMRQIVLDHQRSRGTGKRGEGVATAALHDGIEAPPDRAGDAIDLINGLDRLRELDVRKAAVLEWHTLVGIDLDQIAEALAISVPTVKRDLRAARALLAVWAGEASTPVVARS
ncbi:MAG: hypothetical protein BGP24_17965 [Lysobacterales bacterium 69-70]|nr:RNA polymerase subunit sigma-70 [Xanthomonadaceae bacterium]ODU32666.1 MAG: hypothetical protein ABS97_15125 [Xanthomonadaceae bacterium SCN 69-320]ODV19177.1 MAG: hypothetical protein ABT27_11640 [Xanthomonadaceae bacterium SCN 69-25]OJY99658.1 MAG: hypothetical protein BGP24_17965 [Xanthomonadales bacterium 69-70]